MTDASDDPAGERPVDSPSEADAGERPTDAERDRLTPVEILEKYDCADVLEVVLALKILGG